MSAPIARLTCPDISGIVPRERLFQLIDGAMDRPVTWVSAPAGSGKTTLIASFLDSRKIPCLWYSVDESDGDIASFFHYMTLAVGNASTEEHKPLPVLTPEYLQGLPTFTRHYFGEIYSRLKSAPVVRDSTGNFVIVLDNFQDASTDSQFQEMISYGMDVLPDGIKVIIISRSEPSIRFARLYVNDRINRLGWNDIRFTMDEARKVAESKRKTGLSDEDLMHLHLKTEGWAAGITLLLESAGAIGGNCHSANRMPSYELFDYFADKIFERLDKDTQEFLLKTSFLPDMTIKTARECTGMDTAGEILSDLAQRQYFIERRFAAEPVYKYHPLLREFLATRAKDAFPADSIQSLQRKTAVILENAGRAEEASSLYCDAGEWKALTALILKNAQSLIGQGRGKTLEGWLNYLPKDVLNGNPWLLFYIGICRLPFNPVSARGYLEKAFELFEVEKDSAGLFLSWSLIIESFMFEWKDFSPLDKWVLWFDKFMEKGTAFPTADIEARVLCSRADPLVLWRNPGDPNIKKWIDRAQLLTRKMDDVNLRIQALQDAMNYSIWMGDPAHADLINKEFREIGRSPDASPMARIKVRFLEAISQDVFSVSAEPALSLAMEGIKIAEESGVHVFDHLLYGFGAYACIKEENLTKAKEFLEKMEAVLRRTFQSLAQFHYFSSWHHLLSGDASAALIHAKSSADMLKDEGLVFPEILAHLAMARILIKKSEYDEADAQLNTACKLIEESKSPFLEFSCLLARAEFHLDRGTEKEGLDALRKGMQIGSRYGFATLPWWGQPKVMARLCSKALENGIEVEYVREIMTKQRLAPVPSLSEKEKEVLSWIVQGKSNWEIAQILGVSERTAKFHVENIIKKLNVVNRTQAVAIAVSEKII